jgi:hypothetical protein
MGGLFAVLLYLVHLHADNCFLSRVVARCSVVIDLETGNCSMIRFIAMFQSKFPYLKLCIKLGYLYSTYTGSEQLHR